MKWLIGTIGCTLLFLSCSGCGSSQPESAAGPAKSNSPNAEVASQSVGGQPSRDVLAPPSQPATAKLSLPGPGAEPDVVVREFLQAVRDGNEQVAELLLTDRAREETAKHDLSVQPPGTPSARFEIGAVQYREDRSGAYVESRWTDTDEQGQSYTYGITWALRPQHNGWRIAGIGTEVVPDEPPVFFNFEDPADMMKKWENASTVASQRTGETATR